MTKTGLWLAVPKGENAPSKSEYSCVDLPLDSSTSAVVVDGRRRAKTEGNASSVCCGAVAALIIVAAFTFGFFAGSFLGDIWQRHETSLMVTRNSSVHISIEDHAINKRAVHSTHVLGKDTATAHKKPKTKTKTTAVQKENSNVAPDTRSTEFTFDDIYDSSLKPRSFKGSWWDENLLVYQAIDRNVFVYDPVSGNQTQLIPSSILEQFDTNSYFVSPRRTHTYALLAYNVKQVWRHSFTAQYIFYNVSNGALVDFPNSPELANKTLQYFGWSPSSHSMLFVYENNLYLQRSPGFAPEQVTFNGDSKDIFNGIPDWMYEEDVVSSREATSWSTDSTYFIYVEFNDAEVPTQSWPAYGSADNIYSGRTEIPYPKAGNSTDEELGPITRVTLFAVNKYNISQRVVLTPPDNLANTDYYYTRISWRDDTHPYVVWSNRASNDTYAYLYDVTTGDKQLNNRDFAANGWVDSPYTEPWFIEAGARYITILPKTEGLSGTWPHVAVVTAPVDGTVGAVTFLSSGQGQQAWSIVGVQGNDTVFFTGTNGDPKESHLFSVSITDGSDPVCLTCDNPDTCRFVSASFSETGNFYTESCLGPDIPSYRLKSADGNTVMVLEENADIRTRLQEKQLPTREYVQIPLDGNTDGWAEIFYPNNFTDGEQYQLLVYVYGGPNSQRVTQRFPMGSTTNNWLRHLASSYNIVVASLDGRGTTGRGDAYRFLIYRQLGNMEVVDQLTGVDYLKALPFIDSSGKAAIFGWSYGGQCSSQSLAASNDQQFQCALSVAPVTSKRYYDSAYTERYMAFDLPSDNGAGYDNTDVTRKASQFQGKPFLLAHGTSDDNVHYMNTANFIKALVEEEVQFRQLAYIDENHNIASPKQSRHLFRAMTDFLLSDCWQN